jgi:hypothetical protein
MTKVERQETDNLRTESVYQNQTMLPECAICFAPVGQARRFHFVTASSLRDAERSARSMAILRFTRLVFWELTEILK